jgi:peptidoglycan/LPS O-acetylase OafA/YrhL
MNIENSNSSQSIGKFEELQFLRGIAISLVVFHHLSLSSSLLNLIDKRITNPFYWGVELFFVISGYVITRSLRARDFDPIIFIARRVFRLLPVLVFFVLFAALINSFVLNSSIPSNMINLFSIPSNIFLSQSLAVLGGFVNNISGPISFQFGAMWSLSVELQFYATLTVMLFGIYLFDKSIKEMIFKYLAVIMLITLILYRVWIGITPVEYVWVGTIHYLENYRFDFLIAGVVLAMISNETREAIFNFTKKRGVPFFMFAVTCIVLALLPHPMTARGLSYNSLGSLGMLLCLFTSTSLVAYTTLPLSPQIGVSASSAFKKIFIRVGDLSYSIYLLQFSIFVLTWMIINEVLPFVFGDDIKYSIAQLVIFLIISYPFIIFSYEKIERPFINIGEFFTKKYLESNSR